MRKRKIKSIVYRAISVIIMIVICIFFIIASKAMFDAITNSDLPAFWKWFLLH